mmetsp:Transcript_92513/g.178329  ORF Transcript_92513/g.178329 Transcript_92513/m.178329 type:complete len:81 (+) Transcript_92513:67-309(+)
MFGGYHRSQHRTRGGGGIPQPAGYGQDFCTEGLSQKVMQVPAGAFGVVLGSKGKNMKEMQATPGIARVHLQEDTQDFWHK